MSQDVKLTPALAPDAKGATLPQGWLREDINRAREQLTRWGLNALRQGAPGHE